MTTTLFRHGSARSWGAAVLLAAALVAASPLHAAPSERWIGTWSASPQPVWGAELPLGTGIPAQLNDQTIRQIVRVSLGGRKVRVLLSNEYGKAPLTIGAAHVARADGGARIVDGSDRALTFGGRSSVTILPGAPAVSDPIDLDVAPLSELAVSLHLPQATPLATFHWDGRQTAYLAAGNRVADAVLPSDRTLQTRVFLRGVLVDAPADARAVVAIGDSITDGNGATPDRNRRWPDQLAQRLAARDIAVLNAGISGGRVLSDGMGASALARFDRDVLGQPHVKTAIVLMGINDIAWPGSAFEPKRAAVSAERVIDGYRQLIARARLHSLRIVGATLTPFEGALQGTSITGYHTREKESIRQTVNAWIRNSGEFDAVVDFDAVTRDPEHPTRFLPKYDSGDHLHPGDAGYRAMADAIDERLLFGES